MHQHEIAIKKFENDRGSLSLELAVMLPVFSLLVMFMMGFLQYMYQYYMIAISAARAAEDISCYSSILSASGIDELNDTVKTKLIRMTGLNTDDAPNTIVKLAETALGEIENGAFSLAAKEIVEMEMDKTFKNKPLYDVLKPDDISLFGSSFVKDGDNTFVLTVRAKCDFLFPNMIPMFNGFTIKYRTSGVLWLTGDVSKATLDEINVWELSNFQRGRVIERVFGGNMPDDFPAIDIFDRKAKKVTLIMSLDFTKKRYSRKGEIKKEIDIYGTKLKNFKNGSADDVTINEGDYNTKEMIIVIPKNEMPFSKMRELNETITSYQVDGIKVRLEFYQISE